MKNQLLDMFALIQQTENQDKEVVNELKTELVKYIINGGKLEIQEESILRDNGTPKDDISRECNVSVEGYVKELKKADGKDIDEKIANANEEIEGQYMGNNPRQH